MNNSPVILSPQGIMEAKTPQKSTENELIAAAAMAYYKEKKDYESYVLAVQAYVLSRRRTTELILPYIHQGRPGKLDMDVKFLSDFNLTYKQWHRRMLELRLKLEQVNQYFDDCIAKGWNPSIVGLLKSPNGTDNSGGDEMNLHRQRLIDHASWLLQHTEVRKEIAVLKAVIDTFAIGVKA